MRITITCEECGRRHRLERTVSDPGPIWIVCHECELPLRAVLEAKGSVDATADSRFRQTWASTLDISSSAPAS